MEPKTDQEQLDFYLDAFEMLNKPRRIFMGLEMQVDKKGECYTKAERDLTIRIIREAQADFYKHTLPKFEAEIKSINQFIYATKDK